MGGFPECRYPATAAAIIGRREVTHTHFSPAAAAAVGGERIHTLIPSH